VAIADISLILPPHKNGNRCSVDEVRMWEGAAIASK
jgi:hypothetical protein